MKLMRMLTAGLLAMSMSVAAVSAEMKQSTIVVHAENPDPAILKDYAEIIINHVNDARRAEQLSELQMLPVMCDFAQIRAGDLPLWFDHARPGVDENGNKIEANWTVDQDGNPVQKSCFTVIKEAGFWYNRAAENIAAGNVLPVPTFEQWMNSSSHRKNIMGEDFTHIGIGYYYAPGTTYTYYWSMFLVSVREPDGSPTVFEDQYIPPREPGDADGSHTIDLVDVTKILQFASQHEAGLPDGVTDSFIQAADVNADGRVDGRDASILLNYIAGIGADPDANIADFAW